MSLRQVLRESGAGGALRRGIARELRRAGGGLQRAAARLMSPDRPERMASAETLARLERNRELRDVGHGRRCFVLASGPSTLAQDLTLLRGQTVIAVNEMFLRLERDGVAAAVLIFQDVAYLGAAHRYPRFVADFGAAAESMGADAFVPLAAAGLGGGARYRYLAFAGDILDYPEGAPPPLDFTAPLPVLYTVAHTAIALALYMGFSEILTLGIDLDYAVAPDQPMRHGYGANPYHDHDALSVAEIFRRGQGWAMPDVLENLARQIRTFERLRAIAAARGARIVNLSPVGVLDVFERRTYVSVVAEGRETEASVATTRS